MQRKNVFHAKAVWKGLYWRGMGDRIRDMNAPVGDGNLLVVVVIIDLFLIMDMDAPVGDGNLKNAFIMFSFRY